MRREKGEKCSDDMRSELVHDKGGYGREEFLRRMSAIGRKH